MNHNTHTNTTELSVQKEEKKKSKIFLGNFLVKHHYIHFNEYDFIGFEDHITRENT